MEKCLQEAGHNLNGKEGKAEPIPWSLWTVPFKPKSVVRLGDPKSHRDLAYLKVSIGPQDDSRLQAENTNRAKIQHVLKAHSNLTIAVPQTYGTFRAGNVFYCMESAAHGLELSRIVRRSGYFADVSRVERFFSRLFENLLELTEALQEVSGAPAINPAWREIPQEFRDFPELSGAIEQRRYFRKSSSASLPAWIQHGDLSIENMSVEPTTQEITVFDWVDMAGGFPPLYDLFEILYSTGYLPPAEETVRFPDDVERWTATFNAVFLSDTGFSRLTENLMLRACERLKVKPELIPSLMIEYLLLRTHYYRRKSAAQCKIHLHLLRRCLKQKRSVFGNFPLYP
jgi:hypothetical protein